MRRECVQSCQNVPAADNFAAFSQFLAAYSTLDFTKNPPAGKGTWCLLPTATEHFDKAGLFRPFTYSENTVNSLKMGSSTRQTRN